MNFFFYYSLAYIIGLGILYAYMKAKLTAPPLAELTWTGILSAAIGIGGAYALWKLGLHFWLLVVVYGLLGAYLTYKFLDNKK